MASSVDGRRKLPGPMQPSLEFYAGLQQRSSVAPTVAAVKRVTRTFSGPSAALRSPLVPFRDRPTCSIAEACAAAGFGRTKLYELLDEGVVLATKVGRRRLVRVDSLLAFLDGRPAL
jgi:excisionase family DNA binding protein